jgi:hypothetical protein
LPRKFLTAFCVVLFAFATISSAQTIQRLTHQPPDGALICFQLTDGTVLCQGNSESDWYKLSPDITGSYINGSWTRMANLPAGYVPDAFASAVLADGRVVITGGEYLNGNFTLTNLGAIYDPRVNTWTSLPAPKGWQYIGDSPSIVLPNGTYKVGNRRGMDPALRRIDPHPGCEKRSQLGALYADESHLDHGGQHYRRSAFSVAVWVHPLRSE